MNDRKLFPQEVIRRKRDGHPLAPSEVEFFVQGVTDGSITDAQVAAMAMAIYFQGMTMDERVHLTRAMVNSGQSLDWSVANLPGPTVDKHSTGGVGDKVSLILAPILAACGAVVPMVSGRGLGHTGGTLDKLEAIAGYNATPRPAVWENVLRTVGCAIIGQTDDVAPADRRLYGIRDVTATVESIDLITASILSKKLAAGLERLVMDVKVGSGAFAASTEMAQALARSIVDVSEGAGLPCTAVLTDMNQVLGTTAGNAVETQEAIEVLTGGTTDARLYEVTAALAVELLVGTSLATDASDARARIDKAVASGAAAERFAQMVAALGGPRSLVEDPVRHLPVATCMVAARPTKAGIVKRIDTRAVGMAVVGLGGGRIRSADAIDHGVGLTKIRGLGQRVGPDEPVCLVHARSKADADLAARRVLAAIEVGDAADPGPLVVERIDSTAGNGILRR